MYTTEGQSPLETTKNGGKNNDQLRNGKGKSNGRQRRLERARGDQERHDPLVRHRGGRLRTGGREDFRAWVEENADSLAQEDAAANGTTFEGIEDIEYETEWINDDALFEADYEAACESEWEWMTGR